jgi:hypothetical protein
MWDVKWRKVAVLVGIIERNEFLLRPKRRWVGLEWREMGLSGPECSYVAG